MNLYIIFSCIVINKIMQTKSCNSQLRQLIQGEVNIKSVDYQQVLDRLEMVERKIVCIPQINAQLVQFQSQLQTLCSDNNLFRKIQDKLLDEVIQFKSQVQTETLREDQPYHENTNYKKQLEDLRIQEIRDNKIWVQSIEKQLTSLWKDIQDLQSKFSLNKNMIEPPFQIQKELDQFGKRVLEYKNQNCVKNLNTRTQQQQQQSEDSQVIDSNSPRFKLQEFPGKIISKRKRDKFYSIDPAPEDPIKQTKFQTASDIENDNQYDNQVSLLQDTYYTNGQQRIMSSIDFRNKKLIVDEISPRKLLHTSSTTNTPRYLQKLYGKSSETEENSQRVSSRRYENSNLNEQQSPSPKIKIEVNLQSRKVILISRRTNVKAQQKSFQRHYDEDQERKDLTIQLIQHQNILLTFIYIVMLAFQMDPKSPVPQHSEYKQMSSIKNGWRDLDCRIKALESQVQVIPNLQTQLKAQSKEILILQQDNDLFRKIQQRLLDEIFDLKQVMKTQEDIHPNQDLQTYIGQIHQSFSDIVDQKLNMLREDMRKGMRYDNFRQIRNHRGQGMNYDSSSPQILDLKWKEIQKTLKNEIQLNEDRGKSHDKTFKQGRQLNESKYSHSKSYRQLGNKDVDGVQNTIGSKTITKMKEYLENLKSPSTKTSTQITSSLNQNNQNGLVNDIFLKFSNSQTQFIKSPSRQVMGDSFETINDFFKIKSDHQVVSKIPKSDQNNGVASQDQSQSRYILSNKILNIDNLDHESRHSKEFS